jgi:hypothetical protein
MYLEKPRRLIIFLSLLVLVLVGIWLIFLRAGAPAPTTVTVVVPPTVQQVLKATAAQAQVVITQKSAHLTSVRSIDRSHHITSYLTNGKLTTLVESNSSWTRGAGGCYYQLRTPRVQPSISFAQEYLPAGILAVRYTYPDSGELDWSIAGAPKGAQEHGVLLINPSTHLLFAATIYEGATVTVAATFAYPKSISAPATPTNICKGTRRHVARRAPLKHRRRVVG